MENKNILRKSVDKLFGGIDLKWWKVIIFAVASAVVTTLFLIIPIFDKTSFHKMGETYEAWILFAVIIMSNCKKPLESALKTFVFFLISQPLIYLFQVPFSSLGWQLFGYYEFWFILTILTFPAAFVGWFITKRNWLSLLILSPALVYLTDVYIGSFKFTFNHFPYMIVTALFCLGQVVVYLYAFTPKLWQRLIGFFVPLALIVGLMIFTPQIQLNGSSFLPDNPVLTESAVVTDNNTDLAVITIEETGEDSRVHIVGNNYGTTDFTIKDGKKEYRYTLEIYEDDGGHTQTKIIPKK